MDVEPTKKTKAVAMAVIDMPEMKTAFLPKRSASGLEKTIPTICTRLPTTKNKLRPTAAALDPSGFTSSPSGFNTDFQPDTEPVDARPMLPRNVLICCWSR
jgi:hypothetical protein